MKTLLTSGALIIGAFGLALFLLIPTMTPAPSEDINLLFLYMGVTGGATLLLAYWIYVRRLTQWFGSLRWALISMAALTVILMVVNVSVTSWLMFISDHDLGLILGLVLFAGVIAILAAFYIAASIIARLSDLMHAARRLQAGERHVRLSETGNDELTQLAVSFNQVLATWQKLEEEKRDLEQTRRDWVAWVSHDLRTPLAAMRAMSEALIDGVVDDPETTARYLSDIQREIANLTHLTDDLFDLAQFDAGQTRLDCELTSLRDLISDTLSSLRARAEHKHITLNAHIVDPLDPVMIAPNKIQRVLNNLLDNALKHTPPDGTITLRADQNARAIRVSVHNTGSYIAPDVQAHIFTRFYMGERARGQRDQMRSAGLGLAIARQFVEVHGGTLDVQTHPTRGTCFRFTLPLR
ncbi:MAG: HAMP domain-containing sensor histidine kinase [Chloroflexota bacterium]|nr:HAMP domain-containing sensor histidine kinase [Chloroflexota bacterium]